MALASNRYVIRTAVEDDLEDIYRIEVESFSKPFSYESFSHEFRVAFSSFIVAEHQREVIGYAIAWKVHDEIHLNKIAVRKKFKGTGIGRAMVDYIIETVNPGYARIVLIEVREKDRGARDFYTKLGFVETGVRKSYYIDDDAVLMEKKILPGIN